MTSPPNRAAACAIATPPIAQPRGAERAKPLKLELSRIARAARDATGLTQEAFAAAAETKRAHVKSWEDRNANGAIGPRTDHLLRAPREYRRHWVRELAARDGDVVVQGPAIVHATQSARLGSLLKEMHEALQAQHARLGCDSAETIEASIKELREALVAITEAIAAESVELGRRRAGA